MNHTPITNLSSGPTVVLIDASDHAKIMIEGATAAGMLAEVWGLPELEIGAGAEAGPGQVYRLRPDLFFVHAPPGALAGAVQQLATAGRQRRDLITVTDVTHGRAELRLAGESAPALLSRLCGLDFGPAAFPNLAARFTSLAKTRQMIIRRDEGGVRAYAIIGGRSVGAYLLATILEAGQELGIQAGAGAAP